MADGSIRIDVGLDTRKADKDIAKLKDKIAKLSDTLSKDSARKNDLAKEFNEAGAKLDDVIDKVKYLKEAVKTSKGDKKELLKQELAEAVEEQRIFTAETNKASREYEALGKRIENTKTTISDLQSQLGAMEQASAQAHAAEEAAEKMERSRQRLATFARTATGALGAVTKGAFGAAKAVGSVLLNGLKKVGSVAASAGKALIGFGKNALGLNRNTKQLGQGFKMGLGTLLKYGLGIRSLFVLFRRLRGVVKDAVTAFAQTDSETKKTIEGLKSSLATMKASWGAAFAPILNVVAPILNTLIELCTKAANAVAALFSALTGKGTFKTATKGAEKLAGSLGSAGGAAKEAKKQLAGFDELTILSDNNGGGGGSSGTYEDSEVPDWATQISDMLKAGQWEEFAAVITDKLNGIVRNIPWDSIGQQIGYYLNAAFTIGAKLLTGFDWYQLGDGIGNLITNAINGVNWKNLGTLLVGKVWALWNTVAGLMKTTDWKAVTNAFFDLISGAIYGVDWVLLARRLAYGIGKIFEGIGAALASRDWTQIGQEFTALITRFFTTVDWVDLASKVSAFLRRTVEAATNLLKGIDFIAIATSIGQFLSGVFGEIKWVALANDVFGFLSNLFDEATNLLKAGGDYAKIGAKLWIWFRDTIKAINWASLAKSMFTLLGTALGAAISVIGQFIKDACYDMFDFFSQYITDGGDGTIDWTDIAAGILKGIGEGFVNIVKWIYENIAKPFVQGIKSVFGIHSPSTLMTPFGENIFKGILEGIIDAVKGIGKWIEDNIFTPFMNGIKAIFGVDEANANMDGYGWNIIEGLKNGIVNGLVGIGDWIVATIWTPIKDGLNTIWFQIQEWWSGVTSFFAGASGQTAQAQGSLTHMSGSGATHGGSGGGWHARGGIYNRPTIIGVGEDGAEAIVPLEKHTEWITLVTEGLLERMSESRYANQLANAFASAPMPAMAGGYVVPPNSAYAGLSGGFNDSLMEEIKALRSEISALASQPIQVSSKLYMNQHEVGRSLTEYQRQESRAGW